MKILFFKMDISRQLTQKRDMMTKHYQKTGSDNENADYQEQFTESDHQ